MIFNFCLQKEITEFEKEIGFQLEVNERTFFKNVPRFYASFQNSEAMENGCLVSYHGNGNSVDECLSDYCKIISGKRIAFNSYTPQRKEIEFPKLVHTKRLGC